MLLLSLFVIARKMERIRRQPITLSVSLLATFDSQFLQCSNLQIYLMTFVHSKAQYLQTFLSLLLFTLAFLMCSLPLHCAMWANLNQKRKTFYNINSIDRARKEKLRPFFYNGNVQQCYTGQQSLCQSYLFICTLRCPL